LYAFFISPALLALQVLPRFFEWLPVSIFVAPVKRLFPSRGRGASLYREEAIPRSRKRCFPAQGRGYSPLEEEAVIQA